MSNLTCPKCGGSDSFVSQRNIIKGRGIFVSAKMRSVAVCKVCDEIMSRPLTIETKMPAAKMSSGELVKFYAPHVVLLVIGFIVSSSLLIQRYYTRQLENLVVGGLFQINILILIIRIVIRKRRSMGIY